MFIVPIFFTQTIVIITFLVVIVAISLIYKNKEVTKGQVYTIFIISFLITVPFGISIDKENNNYVAHTKDFSIDFPNFKQLSFDEKVKYKHCLITLGPFSKSKCPSFFTKINKEESDLDDQLKDCIFTEEYGYFDTERKNSCINSLERLSKNGKFSHLQVIRYIFNKSNSLKCKERESLFEGHKLNEFFYKEYSKNLINICAKECFTSCSELFISGKHKKILTEKYFSYFEEVSSFNFNYKINRTPTELAVNFVFDNIGTISLYKYEWKKKFLVESIPSKFEIAIFYDHGHIDYLERTLRNIIEKEFPHLIGEFPFEVFKDEKFLKENFEYYKKNPPSLLVK